MLYESEHSLQGELLKVETGSDFSFPPHLHSSFELIAVTEGEMVITVDKMQYKLTQGEALLIFPNQVHALHTPQHSTHILSIFSSQLVHAYANSVLGKLPESHLFHPNPFYVEQLFLMRGCNDLLRIKGLLYSLCAEFDSVATYRARESEKRDLLFAIFQFVENNYSGDCSLAALAAHTSYHSVYLSRYFKQYIELTYTDYVNRYRINEAAYLLKNSEQKILNIAYDCGFDSLRSFNRSFKRIMGTTPSAYREAT